MEILVNRERLDFRLENESSLGEVIDGLARWLGSGDFAITAIDVNATSYALHDRTAWESMELGEVRQLSVEALPRHNADRATVVALLEYFGLLREAISRRDDGILAELAGELPYVRRRLAQFFPALVGPNGTIAGLDDERLNAGALPSEASAERIRTGVADLIALLTAREREYEDPARELAVTLGRLSAVAPEVVDVPVQLQTGRGQEAMRTIVKLTELLSRVIRLIPLAETCCESVAFDLGGVRAFAEELAPVLEEIEDALRAGDTVLVGDLLEYEVAPRLETLARLVPDGRPGEVDE